MKRKLKASKVCPTCGRQKLLRHFAKNKYDCISCHRDTSYLHNRERGGNTITAFSDGTRNNRDVTLNDARERRKAAEDVLKDLDE